MANSDLTSAFVLAVKHPDTTRTYTINLASTDGTNDGSATDTGFLQGDTISSIAFTTPAGITKDSDSNTTTAITLTVSGGTAGTPYPFEVDVTLASGDIEVLQFIIPVNTY